MSRLAADMLSEGPVTSGRVASYQAAVLLVDISGFTGLVDLISGRFGDQGAERLQDLLNACFTPLVDAVGRHGGQVLAFPGDAAICLWPLSSPTPAALTNAVSKAAACSVLLRGELDGLSGVEGVQVRIRAAITAGPIRASLVGGVDRHWNLIVRGSAIEQLAATIVAASAGDIVLSAEARQAWRPPHERASTGGPWLLEGAHPPVAPGDDAAGADAMPTCDLSTLVPPSIRMRLNAGQQNWLSEFRVVSVMFVRIADVTAAPDGLQATVEAIQGSAQRLDGELHQLIVDEAGLAALAVFGLFGQSHEDNAARAVAVAREVREALVKIAVDPRIGVTTGRVFVGMRGGPSRMEPAVIGPVVVLAARLAAAAEDILCDAATHSRAASRFQFDATPPVFLKGKGVVGDLWRPRDRAAGRVAGENHATEIVGRLDERALIASRLKRLAEHSAGGVIVVTGEPGIGKSALAAEAHAAAARHGISCALGAGDSIQASTTLRTWRSIFNTLVDVDGSGGDEAVLSHLGDLLGRDQAEWFPLLNPVLPIHCPENDRTLNMTADSRANATKLLLVKLLTAVAARRPLFIILEDAHWIDSSSWELIAEVHARVPQLLLLVTMRASSRTDARVAEMVAVGRADTIQLEPMRAPETSAVVAARLGADRLSEDLADWLQARCAGNPLFALELASMLLERGAAVVHDRTCRLASGDTAGHLASLPDTIRGVLAARIDRLSAEEQLTLKVAAVLGRQFDFAALAAIDPQSGPADAMTARTMRAAAAGLLVAPAGLAGGWSFSHALVQEVAYELLPFAQRRTLHRATAEHFEGPLFVAGPALYPLLAYHWERAEVTPKAMFYLEKAGTHALLKASSNPEAEDFLTRLLRLAETPAGTTAETAGRVARASWQRMLAQAVARQGRHTDALSHLERGLGLLGYALPRVGWRSRLETTRGIVVRLAGSSSSRAPRPPSRPDQDPATLEAARLFDSLVQLLYLGKVGRASDAPLLSIVALLRSVTLSERIGASGELSCSYSMLANLLAMFRRPRLALRYAQQAREMAEAIGDQQALFRALTMGQLPAFIYGQWHVAAPLLRQGLTLGVSLRNGHETLIAECTLAHIYLHLGQLDEAQARFAEIRRQSLDSSFVLPQLWALAGSAEVALRRDRLSDAIGTAEECLRLADDRRSVDQNSRFQAHGVIASARSRQGDHQLALAAALPAIRAAQAGAQLSFSAQAGFAGVAEALFAAPASVVAAAHEHDAQLRRWLWRLRAVAYCRPILEPCSLYFRAAWSERQGRRRTAKRQLLKSIRLAEALSMQHEAARGRLALSRLTGQSRQGNFKTGA